MFRLDGVLQSVRTIQSHSWEGRGSIIPDQISVSDGFKPKKSFDSEVLAHLSPLQIVCIGVDTFATESLRGAVRIVGGLFTLNLRTIGDGLIDLVSVVVQAVALPILAVISFIYPKGAERLGLKMLYLQRQDENRALSREEQALLGGLFGIVSIPLSSLRSLLRVPIHLLDAELLSAFCAIFCVVKEPISSIGRLFRWSYDEKLNEYGPKAFENIENKAIDFIAIYN